MRTSIAGVLLDVDGTLVDSNDAHAQAWVKSLSIHGFNVPFGAVRRLIGKGGDKLLPEITGLSDADSTAKAISRKREEIFMHEYLPTLKAFPRVTDLLARMKMSGLRLVTASSAKDKELDALLDVCDAAPFLEARTSSDDADNSKPDPDIVHAALKKIGLPASQVILLGDTPYDVAAGVQAHVSVVALRSGGWADSDLSGAIAVYDDVNDLLMRFDESPFSSAANR